VSLKITTLHRSSSSPPRYAIVYLFLTLAGASAHPTQPELEDNLKDVSTFSDGILSASDDDDLPHYEPNFLPPINVEIPVARSTNPSKPSPSATPPLAPGLLSSFRFPHASSLSQILDGLRLDDDYPPFTCSAPVSPYLTQHSPCHTSHPVRVLSILLVQSSL
jgi:hypothetical protein